MHYWNNFNAKWLYWLNVSCYFQSLLKAWYAFNFSLCWYNWTLVTCIINLQKHLMKTFFFFFFFFLLVDLEHKPDQVWPNAGKVTAMTTTPCTSLIALGLEDGSVILWDKHLSEYQGKKVHGCKKRLAPKSNGITSLGQYQEMHVNGIDGSYFYHRFWKNSSCQLESNFDPGEYQQNNQVC